MKIDAKDFRVREGDEIDHSNWPTKVEPVYDSKKQYHTLLEDHVARLSAQQQLLYASDRHAGPADLSGAVAGPMRLPEPKIVPAALHDGYARSRAGRRVEARQWSKSCIARVISPNS